MAKPLHIVGGLPTEVPAVNASTGAADAGKLPELDSTGRLDSSMLPVGIGADTKVLPATENLAAGDFVNIYDAAGTASVRKADASAASAGKRAHGYVLAAVTSGQNATVYFEAANGQRTGLTAGLTYVLSNVAPGGVLPLASAPATAGHILQPLGVATSATEINVEIAAPIVRG